MTDPLDLDRLVELAEAATPGPWTEGEHAAIWSHGEPLAGPVHRLVDWHYIAAVSPSTVLALVRELREAREVAEADYQESAMWAYQYAGALTVSYDFQEGDIVPLLDVLAALAEGTPPKVEWPAVVPSVRAALRDKP